MISFLRLCHRSSITGEMFAILIVKRDWEKVARKVKSDRTLAMPHKSQICNRCGQLHSSLFLACKYNPPLRVIQAVMRANPWAIFEIDCEKRLPLHLACEFGASPNVIKELVDAYPEAISKRDQYGMLPIHKVCQSYYSNVDMLISKEKTEKYLERVLKLLLAFDPRMVLEKDSNEMNAIDHASGSLMCSNCIKIICAAGQCSIETP